MLESVLGPAEQAVTLAVALELALNVQAVGLGIARVIDLHGVVDHQVGGHHRVDACRISTQGLDAVPHGREVHYSRYAREVLQDHSCRHEGQIGAGVGRAPGGYGLYVFLRYVVASRMAQDVLEQNPNRKGQSVEFHDPCVFQGS